jgi:hypothetical protein
LFDDEAGPKTELDHLKAPFGGGLLLGAESSNRIRVARPRHFEVRDFDVLFARARRLGEAEGRVVVRPAESRGVKELQFPKAAQAAAVGVQRGEAARWAHHVAEEVQPLLRRCTGMSSDLRRGSGNG